MKYSTTIDNSYALLYMKASGFSGNTAQYTTEIIEDFVPDGNVYDSSGRKITYYVGNGSFSDPFFTFYSDASKNNEISYNDIKLLPEFTYRFESVATNTNHPFYITDGAAGTEPSSVLNKTGNGSSGGGITNGQYIEIRLDQGFSGTVYYYCTNHSGMYKAFPTIVGSGIAITELAEDEDIITIESNDISNNMSLTAGGLTIGESSSSTTGGDPYIKTMNGIMYKLQMETGILRMLQADNLIINMEISTPNMEQMIRMIEYRDNHRLVDGTISRMNGGYYSKIWIKNSFDVCEIDLLNKTIKQNDDFNIKPTTYEYSSIRYYNSVLCKKIPIQFYNEKLGSCKLTIELFDSPFIENGIQLETENTIEGVGMMMDTYKEEDFTLTNIYDITDLQTNKEYDLEAKPEVMDDNEIWVYKKGERTIEITK